MAKGYLTKLLANGRSRATGSSEPEILEHLELVVMNTVGMEEAVQQQVAEG